jgi:hypothetical protein
MLVVYNHRMDFLFLQLLHAGVVNSCMHILLRCVPNTSSVHGGAYLFTAQQLPFMFEVMLC